MDKINSFKFYNEFHGHKISDLNILLKQLKKQNPDRKIIYLGGDSSLDNKYWMKDDEIAKAINGYQHILEPPEMKRDVAYHMNKLLDGKKNYCVINTAIEESTIANRYNNLMDQDKFIRQNITNEDILIVSIGGNDIALSPSFYTIWNMFLMMYMNTVSTINQGPTATWGMNYFINLFKNEVKKFVLKLIGNKRPKKIIICMIYYPDEKSTGGWADRTLGLLGYNRNPEKLQAAIRSIFKYATSEIKITGSVVVPLPMFEILDGKNSLDYVERVEPSDLGGSKLAKKFVDCCLD